MSSFLRYGLRAIPILGWLFILIGCVKRFESPLLKKLFWLDVFLSVGVHAAQVPSARRASAHLPLSAVQVALRTMIFGATWWKTLPQPPVALGTTERDGQA